MPAVKNVFISYSHDDNIDGQVQRLVDFLNPLEKNGAIKIWWDNKNLSGAEFHNEISENITCAGIIMFCISPSFLNSPACKDEVKKGMLLRASNKMNFRDILT